MIESDIHASDKPGPPADRAGSRRRRRIVLFGAGILLVGAATAFLYVRPDLPPRTELTAVIELVATGQVSDLSVVDESLIVTRRNGERERVDHLSDAQMESLWASAIAWARAEPGKPISMRKGGSGLLSQLAILATALLPTILVLLGVGLLLRTLRRRRPPLG